MAGITVKNKATDDVITFDSVAEVGSAADFISLVKQAWGEGELLKPTGTGTSVFTNLSPGPFPGAEYNFQPRSSTTSASSITDACSRRRCSSKDCAYYLDS